MDKREVSTAHVAVVDDQEDIRELLETYLSREGYRVSTCADADEFWRLMEKGGVDLVLLDIRMPGEDGYSIARRLQGVSDASIIFLTGLGETVDRVVGLELGADDYIAKPFERRELLARIHAVLRRRARAGTAAPTVEKRLDTLARKLDSVSDFLGKVEGETRHIEAALGMGRPANCPQCGSTITWRRAETGELGVCPACGWTQFYGE